MLHFSATFGRQTQILVIIDNREQSAPHNAPLRYSSSIVEGKKKKQTCFSFSRKTVESVFQVGRTERGNNLCPCKISPSVAPFQSQALVDKETEMGTNSRAFRGERAHSPVFGKEDSPQSRDQTEESTCVSEGESIVVKEHTKR